MQEYGVEGVISGILLSTGLDKRDGSNKPSACHRSGHTPHFIHCKHLQKAARQHLCQGQVYEWHRAWFGRFVDPAELPILAFLGVWEYRQGPKCLSADP